MILAFQFVLATAVFDPFSRSLSIFKLYPSRRRSCYLFSLFQRVPLAAGHHVHSHPGNVFPWFFTFWVPISLPLVCTAKRIKRTPCGWLCARPIYREIYCASLFQLYIIAAGFGRYSQFFCHFPNFFPVFLRPFVNCFCRGESDKFPVSHLKIYVAFQPFKWLSGWVVWWCPGTLFLSLKGWGAWRVYDRKSGE